MNTREKLKEEAIKLLYADDVEAFNRWRTNNFTYKVGDFTHSGLDLEETHFIGINFCGANLSGSSFRKSKFRNCTLTEANCSNTNFAYAEFIGGDLRGADFKDAYMFRTRFLTCKLDQETLAEAKTKEAVILTRLSSVKILP